MNSSFPDPDPYSLRQGLRDHEESRSEERHRQRYGELQLLGQGGMSRVYRAHDLVFHRWVALKTLRDELTCQREALRRFHREAEIVSKMSHPAIVAIYDLWEEEDRPYIVMELIEGLPLQQFIAQRKPDLRTLLVLLEKTALGVAYAHQHGVVHRDLKPQNILVTAAGEPKVIDFGLAHILQSGTLLTKSGEILGTPQYMSPEQVDGRGRDISPRTDVYALGVILYEMLTGVAPHRGTTPIEIFQKIVNRDPIPPRALDRHVPADLETICLKALEKDPKRRYATAAAFAGDLRRFLDDRTIVARPPNTLQRLIRRVRRHRAWTGGAVALLGIALALGTFSGVRSAQRSAAISRVTQQGKDASSGGDWSKAAERFAAALKLDPDDPELERRKRICESMARALQSLAGRDEIPMTDPGGEETPPPEAPASVKEPVWSRQDSLKEARQKRREFEQEVEQELRTVLLLDPTISIAHSLLGDLFYGRHLEAKAMGWDDQAKENAFLAIRFGGEEYREKIEGAGEIQIVSDPPHSEAYLFKYELRGRRLLPLPCSADGRFREIEVPSVDAIPLDSPEEVKNRVREGTAYPLYPSSHDRVTFPLRVKSGSYLILLCREGFVDSRYHALVEPGGRNEGKIGLLAKEEIPPGFIYVPSGSYLAGGVRHELADPTLDRIQLSSPHVPAFFMAKYSVTMQECFEFLDDLSPEERAQHFPRDSSTGKPVFSDGVTGASLGGDRDLPVVFIGRRSASAYADWYTRKYGQGRWTFRLPTEDEWEKAGRGVDGRPFSWGPFGDPAFAAVRISRSRKVDKSLFDSVERVGLHPADESVYGVRDTCGVVKNMTSNWFVVDGSYIVKGNSWPHAGLFPLSQRYIAVPKQTEAGLGFRLAADAPR